MRLARRGPRPRRRVALAACIATTSRQLGYWRDSERLFAHALEVTPPNYLALHNCGLALRKRGRLPEAIRSFRAAVAMQAGPRRGALRPGHSAHGAGQV